MLSSSCANIADAKDRDGGSVSRRSAPAQKERGPVPVRIQTRAEAQSRNRIIPSRNKAIASGSRAFNRSGRFRRIVHTGSSSVTTTTAASTWLPTETSFHFRRGSKSGKNLPNCTGRPAQLLIHELSDSKLGQFA